jgi:ABC-type sugar transport system substrate-binding protein
MNRLAAVLLAMPLAVVVALDSQDASTSFEWTPPDESTPFFVSGSDFYSKEQKILRATSPASQYPLVKDGPQTVSGQVQSFFTNMFASLCNTLF